LIREEERAAEVATIRMLVDTCSTEHQAPDGTIKFRRGLVVDVDGRRLDARTARRWIKNRIAEPFAGGLHGETVTDQERTADPVDLDAQIAHLERLRDRARRVQQGLEPPVTRAPPSGWIDPSRPIGSHPYRDDEDELAGYALPDDAAEHLRAAGFVRVEQIEEASDEDLLEVPGVDPAALAALRSRRPRDERGRYLRRDD